MKRRSFLIQSGMFTASTVLLPSCGLANIKKQEYGVQLYTFRDAMIEDAIGTLEKIAGIGYKKN